MALPENDSSVGHSFGLEFDGLQIKSIQEVTGLKMEQDVIEYKSNTTKGRQVPGQEAAGTVEGGRMHADSGVDRRQQLRQVGQELRSWARWGTLARVARSSCTTTRAIR